MLQRKRVLELKRMLDKLCDNGREGNPCRFAFHDLCYKQHGTKSKHTRNICRHCAVCGLVLRKEVVGDCSICKEIK